MLQIAALGFLFVFSCSMLMIRFIFRKRIQLEKRLRDVKNNLTTKKRHEEEILNKPFAERVLSPLLAFTAKALARFTPARSRQKLQHTLQLAGNPGSLKPHEYQSVYVFVALISGMAVLLLGRLTRKSIVEQFPFAAVAVLAVILLNKLFLQSRMRIRRANFLRELPDVLDLLTVSVEAGLGFDGALLHVIDKSKGTLAEEFKITLRELQMGKSRREALRDLGERTNVDDILTFVGAMIQADQLGVPVSKILRTQAEQVRIKRRQRVEEKAMKAPVKMLLPLVFFIFPTVFIVLLGPAAIRVYDTLVAR
ncbi:MAG: type II secretion system F family protein [Clostridia bacterium]|jgi:tight adherence protein C|nr:type II secretion system F family protein [Clostridia bacterium]